MGMIAASPIGQFKFGCTGQLVANTIAKVSSSQLHWEFYLRPVAVAAALAG